MIWKTLDNGEDNISLFEKIYEKYNPIEFTEKNEISKIYKPNEVIIPYMDSKKSANQKISKKKKGKKIKKWNFYYKTSWKNSFKIEQW